tara:strand:- start:172 stop:444 length:273 start_codon:yes stop_codon:yes gene_type:complete
MAGDIAGHISEQFRSIWENKIMLNKNYTPIRWMIVNEPAYAYKDIKNNGDYVIGLKPVAHHFMYIAGNDMALKLDRHFIEIAINEGIKSC